MSHKIYRAYKYRLYPNKSQANYLDQNFGAARFVWNQLVHNFNSWTSDGPNRAKFTETDIKKLDGNAWLYDMISYGVQSSYHNFQETVKQYFSKTRKRKSGKPQFKSKSQSTDSFSIPAASMRGITSINFDQGTIKIPKIKQPVKCVYDRKFNGEFRSATFSKNKAGQYFVSILVLEDVELKQNTGLSVGVDLGLTNLAILSDGTKIDNPKFFRKSQAKLKRAQQHLSRKMKGSNRYEKQRKKVARIHLKISNQRKHIHHELSTKLVTENDTIILENLNVSGMVKNRKLAKAISDASWTSLIGMIKYKCDWYGKTFHQIDRWYPSSKTCSCCGHKVDKEFLKLSVREWGCPNCGTSHDRDINAATNILHEGLRDLYGFTSDEIADYRRGEELRPKEHLCLDGIFCETSIPQIVN